MRRPPIVITLEMYEALQQARREVRRLPGTRSKTDASISRLLTPYGCLPFLLTDDKEGFTQ